MGSKRVKEMQNRAELRQRAQYELKNDMSQKRANIIF
jgi:hypothetical protein